MIPCSGGLISRRKHRCLLLGYGCPGKAAQQDKLGSWLERRGVKLPRYNNIAQLVFCKPLELLALLINFASLLQRIVTDGLGEACQGLQIAGSWFRGSES